MSTKRTIEKLGEKARARLRRVNREAIDGFRLDCLLFEIGGNAASRVFRYEEIRCGLPFIGNGPVCFDNVVVLQKRTEGDIRVTPARRQLLNNTLLLEMGKCARVGALKPGPAR